MVYQKIWYCLIPKHHGTAYGCTIEIKTELRYGDFQIAKAAIELDKYIRCVFQSETGHCVLLHANNS